MPGPAPDPYTVLGVAPDASDVALRAAYRRAAQLHHPDHNGGSPEAARRFEAVQDAYAQIRAARAAAGVPGPTGEAPGSAGVDPDLESRLAAMERDLAAAREARERARRAAREAARTAGDAGYRRASDEELGYVTTQDSFTKIVGDAASELADHLADARRQRVPKGVSDLIDELAAKLTGEPPPR